MPLFPLLLTVVLFVGFTVYSCSSRLSSEANLTSIQTVNSVLILQFVSGWFYNCVNSLLYVALAALLLFS